MVYVGVDLHRKSSHVAVLAGDGELLASRRIPSRPDEFLRVFGELEAQPVEVAFEATYGWGWFADLLHDVGILADQAVLPPVTDLFGLGGRAFLKDVRLRPIPQARLEANLRLLDLLSPEVAAADRELRTLFRTDPRIGKLLPIPGIGFTTAAVVVAEVWDVSRFPSPDRLCSWAGLTPTEHSSAEHTRRGHISKQGSRWLRWAMVESASRPSLKDPTLRRSPDSIARRRGPKIAKVALARRLLTLCYYALRDEGGCRAYPVPR